MATDDIKKFFDSMPKSFRDPFTGKKPRTESDLCSILVAKHQFHEIDWGGVPMCSAESVATAIPCKDRKDIIQLPDHAFAEYRLFADNDKEINAWGGMAPDAIFFSTKRDRIVLLEAKVDSYFTHDRSPPGDQISRYLSYMIDINFEHKFLLLICPKCRMDWYAKRVFQAEKFAGNKIPCSICSWESIFDASSMS